MKNKTYKELIENPAIKEIAAEAISNWDLSKEDFYNWTMQDIADKMGWKTVGDAITRLISIAEKGNYYFKLYEEGNANFIFMPSDDRSANDKPFILVIPGGGFVNVWNITEGWPIAKQFNDLGYNVVVLTYCVATNACAVRAMEDIACAMKIIKEHQEELNINPDSYITCGFSSGGYIACLWNTEIGYSAYGINKPVGCIPVYPVTSYRLMDAEEWDEGEDKDEFARSGTGVGMEESCNSCFEIPEHVEGFPKTAIFHAAEDEMVEPEHSKLLAKSLEASGIPCRLEIGESGGHGFGDGTGMCMEGWIGRAITWLEE